MLPAGILGFMLPGDPEEGFSANPPIQRWKDRGEGRRRRRESKEHGLKSAVADTII